MYNLRLFYKKERQICSCINKGRYKWQKTENKNTEENDKNIDTNDSRSTDSEKWEKELKVHEEFFYGNSAF